MSSITSNGSGSNSIPVGSRESQRDAEFGQLLAKNAFMNPVGILMTVLASVESAQMQVRQTLAKSDSELAQQQGTAAKATAATQLQAGAAEAVGDGFQATGSAMQSVHGIKHLTTSSDAFKEHSKEIGSLQAKMDEHSAEIEKLHSPNGMGEISQDKVDERERAIKHHEREKERHASKKKEHETQRDHESGNQGKRAEVVHSAIGLANAISKAGTAITTSQAKADTVSTQQTQESLKASRDAIQAAEKNAMDVANQAVNQDPSRIMTGR